MKRRSLPWHGFRSPEDRGLYVLIAMGGGGVVDAGSAGRRSGYLVEGGGGGVLGGIYTLLPDLRSDPSWYGPRSALLCLKKRPDCFQVPEMKIESLESHIEPVPQVAPLELCHL